MKRKHIFHKIIQLQPYSPGACLEPPYKDEKHGKHLALLTLHFTADSTSDSAERDTFEQSLTFLIVSPAISAFSA